jgi:subtilisin family serine protease
MPLRDGGRNVRPIVPLAVVAGFIVLTLFLGTGVGGSGHVPLHNTAAAWRGLVGQPRPQATVGQRMIVVLRSPSLAERVAQAGGLATETQERRWTTAAYASQKQLIADLGAHGLQVAIEYSYARVLNGFSAALDTRTTALLERSDEVTGVYPVRAEYPATVTSAPFGAAAGSVSRPESSLPGFDGRGVTIALLDTGVDRTRPYLHSHVLAGYDALGTAPTAAAQPNPFDEGVVERHGTEMAGILVGSGGPAGAHGLASGATVLPIRIAGWQLDARGEPAVLGRTDQLIAGLERAVDPNDDGDAHDAARIALLPLSEPYAAFSDSPEARAVDGALQLDTLVVAAAGNDGPAGPDFGSISGPGGAVGALTVGAADTRTLTEEARVALRNGLRVGFDRPVPLAGSVLPTHRVEGELVAPGSRSGTLAGLFDRRGYSLVACRPARSLPGSPSAQRAQARLRSSSTGGPCRPARSAWRRESTFRSSASRQARHCQ